MDKRRREALIDEVSDERLDAISVSLTFYFNAEPDPVPEFLVGRRRKNPKVAAYGFHLFSEEPDFALRSDEVGAFLDQCVESFRGEVNPEWLIERGCVLRAYITLHPGAQGGALRLSGSTLGRLAAVGAFAEVEAS